MAGFTVDADAHAAAKESGQYVPEGSPGYVDPAAPQQEESAASLVSDIDPGDEAPAPETEEAQADTAEGKEEEATPPADFESMFQGWSNELSEAGDLSEETRNEVIKNVFAENIPDEFKQQFIEIYTAGQEALQSAAATEAHSLVGGEDSYQEMLKWGLANLDPTEVEVFDDSVLGTDRVKRDAAIKGLYARYQQAKGSTSDFEPDLSHDGGRASGEPIIGSRQELVRIMRTPEYDKDRALREKVARQLQQSMATGKYISD